MSLLEAVVLGALQGLTEFLPVSSSGHLVLMQHFLGLRSSRLFFDVMVHLGTLGAVIVVYRRAVARILSAAVAAVFSSVLYRRPVHTVRASKELRLLWALFLGSIPAAVTGYLLQEDIESAFSRPELVAAMLLVTGLLLQAPRLRPNRHRESGRVKVWQAALVGLAQAVALIPGISRSGATISLALFLGVSPRSAARYSLLLSIPAILGAVTLKLEEAQTFALSPGIVVAGVIVSFGVGYLALIVLLGTLRRGRFSTFSYYCFALGFGVLIALWLF